MKRLSILLLLACTACGQMPFTSHDSAAAKPAPKQNVVASGPSYQYDGQDCNSRAQNRMAMYDRPDTYPISNQQRSDAYQALYSACMREHNWQVAGPMHSPANDASQFAAMSPAAGGTRSAGATTVTAGNTVISTSSVPGATILVIGDNKGINPSQLSSLSPSAGGGSAQNATVVMLQSPNQQMAYAQPVYAQQPTAPLPVAIPVPPPPVAKGHVAATKTPIVAQAPTPTMAPAVKVAAPTKAAPPVQAMYAPVNPNPAPVVHKKLSAPPSQASAHNEPKQAAAVSTPISAQDLSDRQLENILAK
jgi:hypothetical protein